MTATISGVVIFATVVSYTTMRFDAPNPVTYAFRSVPFTASPIRNIRSGGIFSPARCTICSSAAVSAGSFCARGSNLLNSGLIISGCKKVSSTTSGSETSQK